MPASNILDTVRSTCKSTASAHAAHVHVDEAALKAVASQLKAQEVASSIRRLHLPIKFDDTQAEVSLLALYYLLDFGSGYDPELMARYKRDAQELCQYALMAVHLNVKRLHVAWMAAFDNSNVQALFGIDSHEDAPVPHLPGVTMSKPGPLSPLVSSIAQSVREAGTSLQEEGATTFGQAILTVLDGLHKSKHTTPAAALVQELVDNIPGFVDQGLYEGNKVVFARKAQGLVFELYNRFRQEDPRFDFADIASLTADSGATVVAALRAKGVLQVSDELAGLIEAGTELPQGPHERGLRAAAVVACDQLAAEVGGGVTPAQVGAHLFFLTDPAQPLHGQIKKHLTKNTTAY